MSKVEKSGTARVLFVFVKKYDSLEFPSSTTGFIGCAQKTLFASRFPTFATITHQPSFLWQHHSDFSWRRRPTRKNCTPWYYASLRTENRRRSERHSFAKMAKDKGLDNLEVKALLAHSNLATTQRYMGDFDTAHNDAALEKVFLPKETPNEEERLYEQLKKVDTESLKKVLKKLDVSGIRIGI